MAGQTETETAAFRNGARPADTGNAAFRDRARQTGAGKPKAPRRIASGNGASARDAALDVLILCRRQSAWADAALNSVLRRVALSAPDAALCSRLVYGVMQSRMLLDFYLDAFCARKTEAAPYPIAEILRLGAYQILFLDRVPDSAAVNEAVNQAVRVGRKSASGMVNAVLRRLSREKNELPKIPDADPVQALSIRYSHPRWLVEKIAALLGADETERFLLENNRVPPLTIQINPRRTSSDALIEELGRDGVTAVRRACFPDCLELSGSGAVTRLTAFREGKFYAQDPAARLVTDAAGIRDGQSVLDVCAAPGGKSFSAAFLVGDAGSVVACDISADRLKRVSEGAARLGLSDVIRAAQADARVFRPEWESCFDVVLVDAPCSGLGVIRKKPDIRYRDPKSLDALPDLQFAILSNAARYVRPGGTLFYSTCTVLSEENDGVTNRFLSERADFHGAPFAESDALTRLQSDADWMTQSGADLASIRAGAGLTLWPQRAGTDGFYLRRMTRDAP